MEQKKDLFDLLASDDSDLDSRMAPSSSFVVVEVVAGSAETFVVADNSIDFVVAGKTIVVVDEVGNNIVVVVVVPLESFGDWLVVQCRST